MKPRRKKHRGFSEKLYMLNLLCTWVYMISLFYLTRKSYTLGITDLGSYASAAPYIFSQLGIHTGFIIWKAKVENCRKFKDVNRLKELEEDV